MKRSLSRAAVSAGVFTALLAAPVFSQTTFRKYVALGDSLTAGFEGGCLVQRHQNRSYPKIVAEQLNIADFQQPLVSEKALSNPLTGPACLGAVIAGGTITVGAVSQQGTPLNATLARPYDNLGIVGATAADLVDLKVANAAGGTANRFAALVLRNFPGGPFEGMNAVDEANLLNPDLVTVWAGPNDVLGAALSGAAIEGVTLTPTAVFEAKYTQIMTGLRATGRTVVALNIPDVASIPFTTTVPAVLVNPATRQPVIVNGQTVPLLGSRTTATCATAPCPVPDGTLVTLGAASLLAQGVGIPVALGGTGQPLPDGSFSAPATLNAGVLLYPDEVALTRQRAVDLNARIAAIATANGATVVDIHSVFNDIAAHGYDVGGGIVVTRAFLSGGIFSADGFHPSNIGYAIVAKTVIEHLNEVKDTDFELPDMAEAVFTPDTPVVTAAGGGVVVEGLSYPLQMWKDVVHTAAAIPDGIEVVFPAPSKRVTRVIRR
jgi:lysophospholipase L1-like esterase